MTNKFKLLTAALMFGSSATFAAEQLIEVESFSGVSVGTGMISTISCGNSNSVTLRGEKKTIDRIEIDIDGTTLDVSRRESAGSMLGKLVSGGNDDQGSVEVDIVTAGEISLFDLSTGATMTVDACAVNSSSVTVDGSTGSEITLNGTTSQLDLDMSTGATFNRRSAELIIDSVNFDLSTGASANLCGASMVKGDASTGAMVYVADHVDTSDVDLSIGAETSSRRCK